MRRVLLSLAVTIVLIVELVRSVNTKHSVNVDLAEVREGQVIIPLLLLGLLDFLWGGSGSWLFWLVLKLSLSFSDLLIFLNILWFW